MSRALTASIIVGVMTGVLGSFMILRGLSLMGDAISHSVIPGVAISQLLGIPHIIGASLFGFLASVAIGFISEKSTIKKDAILGMVFSSFFALGIILISRVRTMTDLHHILFGNVLTVSQSDINQIITISIVLFIFIILFYKELLITSFDETMAQVYGLNTRLLHYSFLIILTLVIVTSLQIVGAVLVIAMIITPAATSYLIANKLKTMIFISATISAISTLLGMFLSFTFNFSAGASIVLVLATVFTITLLFVPKRGIILNKLGAKTK